ncbi:MAG: hypothetical protein LBF40_09355 [Deltaproteobacteria bacterium]|jgi:hypothetical protein|nr:hypothetical protein [Deltaproteobacteria bacterium]
MPHDGIISNLAPHLQEWWVAIRTILSLCGFLLFLWGLSGLAKDRERRGLARNVLILVCAVLLINNGPLLDALSYSVIGSQSVKSLSYQAPPHPAKHYIQFAVHLVAIIGLIGIGRGVLMLKDMGAQPGRLGTALAHIVGGILCVNLVETLKIMARSMGSETLDLITAITG